MKKFTSNKRLYIALLFLTAIVGGAWCAASFRSTTKKEIASFDEDAWLQAVEESGVDIVDVDEAAEEIIGEQILSGEEIPHSTAVETVEEKTDPIAEVTENADTPVEAVNTENTAAEVEAVETAVEDALPFAMIKPCDGDIMTVCSLEELVYCSAMDDWRTHNGIDYTASLGDKVYAAADGVVKQTYEDELLGYTLLLEHGDSIVSVYCGLNPDNCLKVGAEVKKGDVIGSVGESGTLEADMDGHLHFEVQCGGEYCDPMEYISAE